jgi:hypothetical protein
MRIRGLVALSALVVALVPSVAQSAPQRHVVVVYGRLHASPDALPDQSLCLAAGGSFVPGPTDVPESGTSVLTGTFEGTGRFCGHTTGWVGPDGRVPFIETDTFTGTVHGCGRGTVRYRVEGYLSVLPDASRGGLPSEEEWRIVPGSGTGGLRGLTLGGGHDSGQINPDSSIDTDFAGKVTCGAR